MIRLFLISLLSIMMFSIHADQKYNPYSGEWETVSPNSELKYNPHSGDFEYAKLDSSPKYNAHEGTWDMAPEDI